MTPEQKQQAADMLADIKSKAATIKNPMFWLGQDTWARAHADAVNHIERLDISAVKEPDRNKTVKDSVWQAVDKHMAQWWFPVPTGWIGNGVIMRPLREAARHE